MIILRISENILVMERWYFDNYTVAPYTINNIILKKIIIFNNKDKKKKQNLCLDKADHFKGIEIIKREYVSHIYYTEEKKLTKRHPAKIWVIEITNSWDNRFRKFYTI